MATAKPRTECRKDWQYKNPSCAWCFYKNDCGGPVIAVKGHYNYYNCPDEPNIGNIAKCGTHPECKYCRRFKF